MDKLEAKHYCILGGVKFIFYREFYGQDGYNKQNYTCERCKVGVISLIPAVKCWRLVTHHAKIECFNPTKELIKKYHQQGNHNEWKSFTLRALQDIPEEVEVEEICEYFEQLSTSDEDSTLKDASRDPRLEDSELHSGSLEEVSEYRPELSTSDEDSTLVINASRDSRFEDSEQHSGSIEEASEYLPELSTSDEDSTLMNGRVLRSKDRQQNSQSFGEVSEYLPVLESFTVPGAALKKDSFELHLMRLAKNRESHVGKPSIVEPVVSTSHPNFIPTPKQKKKSSSAPMVVQVPWGSSTMPVVVQVPLSSSSAPTVVQFPSATSARQGQQEEPAAKAKPKQTLMARMKEKVFQPKTTTNVKEVFSAKKWAEHPLQKFHRENLEKFEKARAKLDKAKKDLSSKR